MNIKEILFNDLHDIRIVNKLNELNGSDIDSIYFLHKDEENKVDYYVEYEIVSEKYSEYSANDNKSIKYSIQIDIFSYYDYCELEQIIKDVLKEKDYRFYNGADMYEEDTNLYHKAMRFNYVIY